MLQQQQHETLTHEIEMFLWDQKIDTFLISETNLMREAYQQIKGYKIYHTIWPD